MKPLKRFKRFIYILVFFLLLCLKYSKCEDYYNDCHHSDGISCIDSSNQACSDNCKPKYGSGNCYDCNIITGKYYTIIDTCLNQCLGDKIIGDSGECTYETPSSSFKKLGDVYYSTAPSSISCNGNICSCDNNNYFHLETLKSKKIYTCFNTLSEARANNYLYYNYKVKEFFETGCPNGFNIQKKFQ